MIELNHSSWCGECPEAVLNGVKSAVWIKQCARLVRRDHREETLRSVMHMRQILGRYSSL